MEYLFESSLKVKNINGKLYFFQTRPNVTEEPVLVPDTFADGAGTSIYGSVHLDQGMFRMWYQAWPKCWKGENIAAVGYAESDDGISWKKPELNLIDLNGKNNNICDLGFHSPAVFIDPEAPDSHRYRATGHTHAGAMGTPEGPTIRGYYTAHSSDGIHWQLESNTPTWDGADVITSIYHPQRKEAIVALKHNVKMRGVPRRAIWNAFLKDGEWTDEVSALVPDDYDDICALTRGQVSGDYYGMGMMPAGAENLIGFVWQFRHNLPRTQGSHSGVFGVIDTTLAFQERAGDRWLHFPGRQDFLSHQILPWTRGGIYTASNVVDRGNEQRLYFCGATETHGWYINEQWQVNDRLKAELIDKGFYRIGYASWPKNRLFGWQADPEGSIEFTVPEMKKDFQLLLNYETETNGEIKVELKTKKENDNYSLKNSKPLTGNKKSEVVTWNDGSIIKAGDKVIAVKVYVKQARFYGYEVKSVD